MPFKLQQFIFQFGLKNGEGKHVSLAAKRWLKSLPTGEPLNLVVVTNRSRDRANFTFQPEQKVQDVVKAIKQREGWHSRGIFYHNYFDRGEFVCKKLSADLSQPLYKLQQNSSW